MTTPTFLVYALSAAWALKYPLIFVGAFVEGPILMIGSGFLIRHGMFPFWPVFAALVLGDLAGDTLWYCLGRYLMAPIIERKGKFMGIDKDTLERTKALFNKYHERILIISKVTLGFGLALGVLMVAGTMKVPFKKYIAINAAGELFLVATLMSLGYFFGDLYERLAAQYHAVFLILLVLAILAITYGISRVMKKVALKVRA